MLTLKNSSNQVEVMVEKNVRTALYFYTLWQSWWGSSENFIVIYNPVKQKLYEYSLFDNASLCGKLWFVIIKRIFIKFLFTTVDKLYSDFKLGNNSKKSFPVKEIRLLIFLFQSNYFPVKSANA